MSEQERKLFEMYGKKPVKNVLSNMQKVSLEKMRKNKECGCGKMELRGVVGVMAFVSLFLLWMTRREDRWLGTV